MSPKRRPAGSQTEASPGTANPPGATVRIMLADDHEVVRQGLRALVTSQPGWMVCCEAATGREAVRKAEQGRPDIVILDVSMPGLNGLDAARRIRQLSPSSRVLILTMHQSDELLREALAIGVSGYVLKSDAGRELVAAVAALTEGKRFVSSGAAGALVDTYLHGTPQARADEPARSRLTSREREIVQLLAEGQTNKDVARALDIAVKTVETHRTNIFQKLEIHSIADLVRYAVRNRIIEP